MWDEYDEASVADKRESNPRAQVRPVLRVSEVHLFAGWQSLNDHPGALSWVPCSLEPGGAGVRGLEVRVCQLGKDREGDHGNDWWLCRGRWGRRTLQESCFAR